MATVVLTAVGAAIGGPVGGYIGAAIGGAIDQQLFAPDPVIQDTEGPRLNDLKVTASTYGQDIPIVYGAQNRLSGNIIWTTGLIENRVDRKVKVRESTLFSHSKYKTVTTYTYSTSLAIAICEGPIARLKKIYANGELIFDGSQVETEPTIDPEDGQDWNQADGDTHFFPGLITFYPGNKTQKPSSFIEAFEGAGNVPGYRNICYVLIRDLQLKEFGNRIPNFEFEIEESTSISVAGVLEDISNRAGLNTNHVSRFGLDDVVKGYAISKNGPAVNAILPLSIAYNFDTIQQNGDVRFKRRARAMKATIEEGQLAAREPNAQKPETVTYTNASDYKLPSEITVSFKDPEIDYQVNSQRAFKNSTTANNKVSQEIPLVLSVDEARQAVDRLLFGAWSARKTSRFSVSDTWVRLAPGDILGLPVADQIVPYKLINAVRGNNGIIQIEARYEDPEVFNSTASGQAGQIPTNRLRNPGVTTMVAMDMPLLHDSDDGAGFYWSVTATSRDWSGAEIQRSEDGGSTFDVMSEVRVNNTIANVIGTLPDGPTEFWDRGNTLTVQLIGAPGDELESLTELEVLNGDNAAWVGPADGSGGEIIQFATATLIETGKYELTDLLRGRLGTERNTGVHSSGELFVLLTGFFTGISDFGVDDWDAERTYRPVSFYTQETDASSFTFTNTGVLSKPYSPTDPRGSRDGSNNLTITWKRRTRYVAPGIGGGETPLGEESEAYEIDILDGSGSVLRTINTTTETATYTAAQQTTDGLTPGDFVTMDIYQISATRGRGFAKRAII